MSYSLISPRPANLATNEDALLLSSGTEVAVSVAVTWDTSGGAYFVGNARAIDSVGNTLTCPYGCPVTTSISHYADTTLLTNYTTDTLMKEIILAMIGEPLTTRTVDGQTVALVPWSDAILINADVSTQAALASVAGPDTIVLANAVDQPLDISTVIATQAGTVLQTELGVDLAI